jgi:hypothetical protein
MAVPSRKEELYFMFWRVVFLFSSSVYVVLYTGASDTVAFQPSGTLTVRIAAKCFTMALDRSFPLSPVVGEVGEVKVNTKRNVLEKAYSILDARAFSTKLEIYLH